ncbi:MAG: flavodoxin domain-containing protein [Bradymonadaceae bacterium]|nr:flavodoxin domain-containing protein [Lujinxingiaceae bacterium]
MSTTKIAVVFATADGQTHKIAENIAALLRERGAIADVTDGHLMPDDFPFHEYDGAIVGGSIHMGKNTPFMEELIVTHSQALVHMPTAFFAISLSSTGIAAEEDEDEADEHISALLDHTHWRPRLVGLFAGGLRYTQYGFVKRQVASDVYERLNWVSIDRFTYAYLHIVTERKERHDQQIGGAG